MDRASQPLGSGQEVDGADLLAGDGGREATCFFYWPMKQHLGELVTHFLGSVTPAKFLC